MKKLDQHVLDLQDGKEAALASLIDEFSEKLLFFAYKIVKDKNIAEEIISDSFIKLWERRGNFSSIECIKSFLFLVTKNACLDALKQSRSKFEHSESFLMDLKTDTQDVLTKIIYYELIDLIAKEIEKFPKKQAQIIQLSLIEGRSTEEICEELETTPSTVYFARSKAISTLKQVFKQKNISYYQVSFLLSILWPQ
ncbi:RNA polymerase sigma factor [Sphingobacterium sp. BIGb0165]|uniref:RNA polymerase sigma factor n=1 Tax=Sphingobacterium sp. BIGb0165 TaxID=2940615 RepID=UPI00216A6718|nr:sigma-70 family RNA polymerase sigma factor [Sphingobacterium sp. BIGb0165]MCS4225299.1 RNA polymerase sigma-70 factor (ECF subfamily) [Sphingobacterium sp. BIGb0165]